MGQTTELGLGKTDFNEMEEPSVRETPPPGKGKGMKRRKKVLLLSVAAVALVGLVAGGIAWTKRGVVKVQTGKVAREDLTASVTASGEVKPKYYANVNANSYGKIVEILVNEGDAVKKGQLLLKTESVQQEADVQAQEALLRTSQADSSGAEAAVQSAAAAIRTAQADLQQARANSNRAKEDYARAQQMHEDRLISEQLFDQRRSEYEVAQANVQAAEARLSQARAQQEQSTFVRDMARARVAQARAQLLRANDLRAKTIYTSPLDAIVTSLPVHVGENVVPGIQNQPGSLLFQVSDLSVITAEVKVDETDIVNVKFDQPSDVTIDAIPNKTFKGKVTEIGQSALSRTSGLTSGQSSAATGEAKDFKVVVTLEDPPPNLRPGLSTTAKIVTATRQNAVTVPIQALTIRQRRELEAGEKESKGKMMAAAKPPASSNPTTKDKDKGKEELEGVFVLRGGRAVFAPVETGIMGATEVEIVKGLQPGEEIVTGSYKALRTLKNNAKVKVDNSPAEGGPQPSS